MRLQSVEEGNVVLQEAFGGKVTKDQLLLYFGPNERRIGRHYRGDPTVDESKQTLSQFSVLGWLQRFPHWRLGVRLLPAAPPAPGVATFRAAAMSEGKDPDQAVQEARSKVQPMTCLSLQHRLHSANIQLHPSSFRAS